MRTFLCSAMALAFLYGCSGEAGKTQNNQFVYSPYTDMPAISSIRSIDPKDLFLLAKQNGGGQGKYESDKDFYGRISSIGNFEVCKNVSDVWLKFNNKKGLYSFGEILSNAYDMGVDRPDNSYAGNFLPVMQFYEGQFSSGEYVGQNAFGAQAIIDKRSDERVYLAFTEISSRNSIISFPKIESEREFSSSSHELRLCVTAVPVAPYLLYYRSYMRPTISNPRDGYIDNYFYVVKIAGMSLVDRNNKIVGIGLRLNPGYFSFR